jgi:hypothetical protein
MKRSYHELEGDSDAALAAIDEALDLIEDLEVNHEKTYDRGADFFESVSAKLKDIYDTIEQSQDVSNGQANAIDNMCAAVKRWHPDHK